MEVLGGVLQGLLAAAFLMAGLGKIFGAEMHKKNFDHWRLPQWFRVVTGLVETVAAGLLIVGYWQYTALLAGAWLLVATGFGGVFTHIRVKDSFKDTLTIAVLGILAIILLVIATG
ncbi:DoxX family protein [Lysinibacillus sp. NPDC097287]|uniref:DoxX family protein n=1 Tax=Lysinibacillus sp. NPDC097287 TaxID=3364144 RepID=UPI00382AD2D1